MGLSAWVGWINFHDTYDDAFIIFRYAYNFATGEGFVYNTDARFFGLTAPLYGLLLGVLGLPWPSQIPTIAGLVSVLSLTATGVGLATWGILKEKWAAGFLAGAFFVVNHLLLHTFGGEMLFLLALVVWAFVAYEADKTNWAVVLLAISVLTRPDAIIVAGVIGLGIWIKQKKIPLREMMLGAAILLPFVVLAWIFYGSPLPATLDARLAQGDSGLWPFFVRGMYEWIKGLTVGKSIYAGLQPFPDTFRYLPIIALGIPGLFFHRFWLPLVAWVALYVGGYHLLEVPFYHWYVLPVALVWSILLASGILSLGELGKWLYLRFGDEKKGEMLRYAIIFGVTAILLPSVYAQISHMQTLTAQQPDAAEQIYEQAGRWLAKNTDTNATIGYLEIGYIGYYAQRTLIDPLGLTVPEAIPHISTRDFTWVYEKFRPDYIVVNPRMRGFNAGLLEKTWFQKNYQEINRINQQNFGELIIFRSNEVIP
jgi:hypothetical protein